VAAIRVAPDGSIRSHSAREAEPTIGSVAPTPSAIGTSTKTEAPASTAITEAVTNTAKSAVTNANGRVGPKRSISLPWTTEPIATPTSAAAETMPAIANEPVARST
jgi:hypothetical protein